MLFIARYVDPGLGWAEIKFEADMLTTGFTRSSVGLLVSLGDVPLQQSRRHTWRDALPNSMGRDIRKSDATCLRAGRIRTKRVCISSVATGDCEHYYVLRSINNKRADILLLCASSGMKRKSYLALAKLRLIQTILEGNRASARGSPHTTESHEQLSAFSRRYFRRAQQHSPCVTPRVIFVVCWSMDRRRQGSQSGPQ